MFLHANATLVLYFGISPHTRFFRSAFCDDFSRHSNFHLLFLNDCLLEIPPVCVLFVTLPPTSSLQHPLCLATSPQTRSRRPLSRSRDLPIGYSTLLAQQG